MELKHVRLQLKEKCTCIKKHMFPLCIFLTLSIQVQKKKHDTCLRWKLITFKKKNAACVGPWLSVCSSFSWTWTRRVQTAEFEGCTGWKRAPPYGLLLGNKRGKKMQSLQPLISWQQMLSEWSFFSVTHISGPPTNENIKLRSHTVSTTTIIHTFQNSFFFSNILTNAVTNFEFLSHMSMKNAKPRWGHSVRYP